MPLLQRALWMAGIQAGLSLVVWAAAGPWVRNGPIGEESAFLGTGGSGLLLMWVAVLWFSRGSGWRALLDWASTVLNMTTLTFMPWLLLSLFGRPLALNSRWFVVLGAAMALFLFTVSAMADTGKRILRARRSRA